MFQQPTAGSDFKAKNHVGHLLLIYVRELRTGIVTKYGPCDAISCDVVVLTDPAGPRLEPGVLFFQKPLMNSLRGSIGADPVLARLGQGVAKPDMDPPYILNPFDQSDAAYATQWLTSLGGNPFRSAPTVQQPPAPAPAPVPQMAPIPQAAPVPMAAALPQAPGVPAAPPQWAAPQAAAPGPIAAMPQQFATNGQAIAAAAPQAVPVAAPAPAVDAANAAAAMAALGMQVPPIAPQ